MIWMQGDPVYLVDGKPKDRHIWLQLHDQGGWPFRVIGYLHGEHTVMSERRFQKYMEWIRQVTNENLAEKLPPKMDLEPWLRVPSLNHDARLQDWWNIDYWAEIEEPLLPHELAEREKNRE